MTSLGGAGKEDQEKLTDAEENPQKSESDRTNPDSPVQEDRMKKMTTTKARSGAHEQSFNADRVQEDKPDFSSNEMAVKNGSRQKENLGDRLQVFAPPKTHILQSHLPHRRHYHHHLRDHFSSTEVLSTSSDEQKKDARKEILPTRDACEYKVADPSKWKYFQDTNFLTEGSPPRTPIHRSFLKARSLSEPGERSQRARDACVKRKKQVRHLAASYWTEAPDRSLSCRPSPQSDSGDEISKSLKYLNKYKNESVAGPRSSDSNIISPNSNAGIEREEKLSKISRQHKRLNASLNNFAKATESSRSKILMKEQKNFTKLKTGSSSYTASSAAMASRSKRPAKANFSPCQNCKNKLRKSVSTWTQTETADGIFQATSEVKKDADEDAIKRKIEAADLSLYLLPNSIASSESNSLTTEDASSVSFDDDYVIHYGVTDRRDKEQHDGKSDILSRVIEVQEKLQRLKKETEAVDERCGKPSVDDKFDKTFSDLCDIITDISELYDDFDTEDKGSEFNDIRKQLLQCRRNCHILEHEVIRVNSKLKEETDVIDYKEEMRMTQQISTALYGELQNADIKLQKLKAENDLYREKLVSCEVQQEVFVKEVTALRNTIDQMSLHASSVPANDSAPVRSRDAESVSELHRQIQFQDEERKAILKRLIETDKEKEKAEETVRVYWDRYGEISSLEQVVNEEERKENNLKSRIRMAEDQVRMLGRKVIHLQMEKESFLDEENNKVPVPANPDTPARLSLSDIQFLEDEVETLRTTLDEVEKENCLLKYELRQYQEKSSLIKNRTQVSQQAAPSLKEQLTPTISDKIASWNVSDPGTPHSDFTLSGACSVPILTAIDACTQTHLDTGRAPPTPRLTPARKSSAYTFSKELMEIISRTRDSEIEALVSQLTNLAIATRHLVDDSTSLSSISSTDELHSSSPTEDDGQKVFYQVHVDEDEIEERNDDVRTNQREKSEPVANEPHEIPTENFEKFHILLLSLMAYVIVTSLPLMTTAKLGILGIFFFLI